ncbi:MAG: hypothetical protein IJ533_06515 [Prevotella sp.]|nr:hypothetical protein [Prevotella sp.]
MKKQILTLLQLLAFSASSFAATGDDVSAKLDSYRAATLDNGLVRLIVANDGRVSACTYEGQSLIPSGSRFYFSCNQPDYAELKADAAELRVSTADMAEVVYTQSAPTGGIRWSQGYIVRRGVSGFYTYLVAEGVGDNSLGEARMVYRLKDDLFNYGYVNSQMQGQMPSAAEMKRSEDRQVQDATFTLDDGTTIYTKYNWANYVKDDHFHGLISDAKGIGAWSIPVSTEYINGGPMRQDLTVHASDVSPLILQMLHGTHFGAGAQTFGVGTRKIYGPFFFYLNKGTREEMIADAAKEAAAQEAQWPFAWFNNDLYPVERSTVSGRISQSGYDAVPLQVVLAQPGSDVYDQGDGYIFQTVTDADGRFTITGVRPGTYTLTAYALSGANTAQLTRDGIAVSGSATDLGTIRWDAAPFGTELWRIGESNRLSDGYKLSDAPRAYELYQGVPADLVYTIGTSSPSADWYYAQAKVGTWRIKFNLAEKSYGQYRLTCAIAGAASVTRINVSINGGAEIMNTLQSDGSVYRSAVQSGRYQQFAVDIPASQLKVGDNTIDLLLTDHNYATSGVAGVMYDCLKLELNETVELYNFTGIGETGGTVPTWGDDVTIGGQSLQMLASADENFNNRFACGPKRGDANVFKFRDSGSYKGLYSQYSGRYLSILNLKQGDRVTVTMHATDNRLQFASGDMVENGKTYTVDVDGSMDFVSTGAVYIESIKIEKAAEATNTCRTMVADRALDFTGLNVKAYIATEANAGTVTFAQVTKVPAATPLYLVADSHADLTVDIPTLTGTPDDVSTNLLKGSATTATELTSDAATRYYVLGTTNGATAFYYASSYTSKAGKAYLELTAEQAAAASRIALRFDGVGPTAVSTVSAAGATGAIYNLRGQRVVNPTRGLYIVGGKKVIIK